MLCTSLIENEGVLTADKTIKYSTATSVLKQQIGEHIQLGETAFVKLAEAFFKDMESKFQGR
jgi:hypothetical protein